MHHVWAAATGKNTTSRKIYTPSDINLLAATWEKNHDLALTQPSDSLRRLFFPTKEPLRMQPWHYSVPAAAG